MKEAESGGRLSFKMLLHFQPMVASPYLYSDTMSNQSLLSASGEPLKKKNYRGYMEVYERRYVNEPSKLKKLEAGLNTIQEVYETQGEGSVEKWKDMLGIKWPDKEVLTLVSNITYANRHEYVSCMIHYEYLPCQFVATFEKIQD